MTTKHSSPLASFISKNIFNKKSICKFCITSRGLHFFVYYEYFNMNFSKIFHISLNH